MSSRNKRKRKAQHELWINIAKAIYMEILPKEHKAEYANQFPLLTVHKILPTLEATAELKYPRPKDPFRKHIGRIIRAVLVLAPRFNMVVPEVPSGYMNAVNRGVVQPKASNDDVAKFYESYEWRKLRYKILVKYGRRCLCCGSTVAPFHVDHIKPLRKHWDLRLDPDNLQVLCALCNHGKGNWDQTDFRPAKKVLELVDEIALDELANKNYAALGVLRMQRRRKA